MDYDNESVITLIFHYRENYATAIQKRMLFSWGLDIIIGALGSEGSGLVRRRTYILGKLNSLGDTSPCLQESSINNGTCYAAVLLSMSTHC